MKLFCCAFFSLALCTTAGAAQVYKWTDANGVVHYSQTMPRSGGAQTLQVKTGSGYRPVDTPNAPAVSGQPAADEPSPDDEQAKAQKIKEQCQVLQEQMDLLVAGGKVYEMRDGERTYLTAQQITDKRTRVRDLIESRCRGKL